jgi:hypothetical protein
MNMLYFPVGSTLDTFHLFLAACPSCYNRGKRTRQWLGDRTRETWESMPSGQGADKTPSWPFVWRAISPCHQRRTCAVAETLLPVQRFTIPISLLSQHNHPGAQSWLVHCSDSISRVFLGVPPGLCMHVVSKSSQIQSWASSAGST